MYEWGLIGFRWGAHLNEITSDRKPSAVYGVWLITVNGANEF